MYIMSMCAQISLRSPRFVFLLLNFRTCMYTRNVVVGGRFSSALNDTLEFYFYNTYLIIQNILANITSKLVGFTRYRAGEGDYHRALIIGPTFTCLDIGLDNKNIP